MQDESVGRVAGLMREVVEQMVSRPEDVSMVIAHEADVVVLDVQVDAVDRGRVIGSRGRTAEALRTIVRNMGGGRTRYELQVQGGKR